MIQFIRGNTLANDGYIGPSGSLSVDTQVGNIRPHDGLTPGGWVIANVDNAGKTYRWGGTAYTEISSGDVSSVNGQTGTVVIPNADAVTAGLMSTGNQTFSGNKTFSGVVTIDEGLI